MFHPPVASCGAWGRRRDAGRAAATVVVVISGFAALGRAEPVIDILEAPPPCCFGEWSGTLRGTVVGVDPQSVDVVLYARTDAWYIQPYAGSLVPLDPLGRFSSPVRGGIEHAALVVQRGFAPEPMCAALPTGPLVLASVVAPGSQRTIEFAGQSWIVKRSLSTAIGPGPNLWSDDEATVWTDAGGLHLRLAPGEDAWHAAEVYTRDPVGWGRHRFTVEGPFDALDPGVVFACFLYSDLGSEIDVEWARWGDPASPTNLQFVVHPDRERDLGLVLGSGPVTCDILWLPDRVEFALFAGASPAPLAAWVAPGPVPDPTAARLRFNLWPLGGASPGEPVEFVVRDVASDASTDAWAGRRNGSPLEVLGASRGDRVRYRVSLAVAERVRVRLLDVAGRSRATLFEGVLPAARYEGSWIAGDRSLGPGVYLVELEGRDVRTARKLVVGR